MPTPDSDPQLVKDIIEKNLNAVLSAPPDEIRRRAAAHLALRHEIEDLQELRQADDLAARETGDYDPELHRNLTEAQLNAEVELRFRRQPEE